jgi:hypothetical protein
MRAKIGVSGRAKVGRASVDQESLNPAALDAVFNGTSANVVVTPVTFSGTARTIAARYYATSGGTADQYLFDMLATRNVFAIRRTSTNLAMHISPSWFNFGTAPQDNAWHTVVFIVNGTTGTCYLDGVQSGGSQVIVATTITGGTTKRIGSAQDGGAFFAKMRLGKTVLAQTAWTADDVTAFHATLAHPGSPQAIYLFNESAGQTILDHSGNGFHGTGTGLTWEAPV